MFQPFVEYWQKHECPGCKTKNWTYHSHSQRFYTGKDPEVCRCFSCKKRYWLISEEDVLSAYSDEDDPEETFETLMDQAEEADGRSTPN